MNTGPGPPDVHRITPVAGAAIFVLAAAGEQDAPGMRSVDELFRLLGAANGSSVSVGRSPGVSLPTGSAPGAQSQQSAAADRFFYAKSGSSKMAVTREEAGALLAAGARRM
jgi:hypothetical protein